MALIPDRSSCIRSLSFDNYSCCSFLCLTILPPNRLTIQRINGNIINADIVNVLLIENIEGIVNEYANTMLHKLKTVNPKSLLMFSTSLVALLIISPLPFFWIHSGS